MSPQFVAIFDAETALPQARKRPQKATLHALSQSHGVTQAIAKSRILFEASGVNWVSRV